MTQKQFLYTGAYQYWTVPDKVYSVSWDLHGAGSAGLHQGGKVTGTMAVSPGDVFAIVVGGGGKANVGIAAGAGGWGGGGAGAAGRVLSGGDGGGGYSAVRRDNSAGKIIAVAGGAGGNSGDSGPGGHGGASIGGGGGAGTGGSGGVILATGGTQVNAGHYGEYPGSTANTKGTNGADAILGAAGHGGSPGTTNGPGGGGGGGGYYPGGGGGAGLQGHAGGGGGGGGSNFTGTLSAATSTADEGGLNDGTVYVTYETSTSPTFPNNPSVSSPDDQARLKANKVVVTATVSASYKTQLRLAVALYYFDTNNNAVKVNSYYSDYIAVDNGQSPKELSLTIDLDPAKKYTIDVFAEDTNGTHSLGHANRDFYSNFPPNAPTLNAPPDNATFQYTDTIEFSWSVNDDDNEDQGAATLEFLNLGTGTTSTINIGAHTQIYITPATRFQVNQYTKWRVKTADPEGNDGPWSDFFTFFLTGAPTAPKLLTPSKDAGLDITQSQVFTWKFQDPAGSNHQVDADFRYRAVGDTNDADWITIFGNGNVALSKIILANTFQAGVHYEWQVRTYDANSGGLTPSAWSTSLTFYAVESIGGLAGDVLPASDAWAGTLGCGDNKAYLFAKGGKTYLGALTPLSQVKWGRSRDDISTCTIRVDLTSDLSCCGLLTRVRSWQHEIVIYRDDGTGQNSRVWEGPITRIEYGDGYVEIEARDVMAWVYRRILKTGYNDAYPRNQTVVFRAARIIIDALARDDPNVLPYLTQFNFLDDAKESRVVPDYATTAWQEVDDLAAKAGLDYVTVGRRIILFDTHRPIGKLPVMRSRDFSAEPVVTEYGMNLATEYAVSNGAGLFGAATKDNQYYGPVELLVSSYGDTATGPAETLTAAATTALIESLQSQAKRGIADRWPTPLVVRVPDNSNIQPDAPFTINQLVPGVWVPLQATHVCREFSQWQKLDSVTVIQDQTGEQVQVVMSPAPNAGADPDADDSAEEDSGN